MPTVTTGVINDPISQNRLWQNGIGIEIEEIEVKNEEYPITIGFLKLMKSLFIHCDANQPQQQQSSSDVCLNFIINSILLKTNARLYKNEEEKWIITQLSYDILHTVIQNYEPFVEGTNSKAAFSIFSQILQESGLFRHIIATLEDIADNFESQMVIVSFQSNDNFSKLIEDSALNALKILRCICEKQNDFIEMVHEIPGFPLAIIVKFDVLFNNVNPRTGSIDRLSTLIRLICLPTPASIETLKVLNSLCRSNPEVSHLCLLQLQNSNSKVLKNEFIINSFVECLETESKELRLETLNLIVTCLDYVHSNYSYNLAHKLLGIDRTSLKEVGNLGQTFTCFHSILSFFDSSDNLKEYLEERRLGMQILYKLCVSLCTYETILRFLRSSYDFIIQYLQLWEKRRKDPSFDENLEELILPELTFFLQILTIDIKITSEQNLKSHCATYVNFLFVETKRGRILDLLNAFVFTHSHPLMPNLEFFEPKGLWKAISECSSPSKSIDLKALHQRLLNEIRLFGPQLGVVQTNLVRNELKTILTFGASLNESQQKLSIKNQYFEAWRELLEILVITRSLDLFDEELRLRYLMEINQELINRASEATTSASLLNPISSAILIISSALYDMKSHATTSNIASCVKSIMNALDSSSNVLWTDQKITRINFYGSLLYLFRSLPYSLFNELKYSNRLLERLAKDMLAGHEVAKVLSISILNRSDLSMWLNELLSNGTLRQLLDSLLNDDREIRANKCEFIKAFYVFESKMVFNA
jgi:nuclear pore complex protein Nup205